MTKLAERRATSGPAAIIGVATAPWRYRVAKRTLDLAFAALALLWLAPLWLLIAIAIKLDSRGPVFFRQQRVGQDGRLFTCYKFRSMRVDADPEAHRRFVAAFMRAETAGAAGSAAAPFKLQRDPRVTRVGRLLRKTSLDELPQFLNVLLGSMSVVGPRPALPYEVEQYQPWQRGRLAGKPGITGPWQVYGRSRVPFEAMVRMDIAYLHRHSLVEDIKLIVLTVPAVVVGHGAG